MITDWTLSHSSASSEDVSQPECSSHGRESSPVHLPPSVRTQSLSSQVFSNICDLLHGDRSQTRPALQEPEHSPSGSPVDHQLYRRWIGSTVASQVLGLNPGWDSILCALMGFPSGLILGSVPLTRGLAMTWSWFLEALRWLPDLWEGVECSFTSLWKH